MDPLHCTGRVDVDLVVAGLGDNILCRGYSATLAGDVGGGELGVGQCRSRGERGGEVGG